MFGIYFLYFYVYRMVFAFLFFSVLYSFSLYFVCMVDEYICVCAWWGRGGGWLTLRTKCDWLTEYDRSTDDVGFLLFCYFFFCFFLFFFLCLYIYIFIWLGPEDQSRLFALIIIIVVGIILFALFRWFFRRFRTLFGTAIGSTAAAVGLKIFDGTIVIVLGLGCLSLPLL